MDVLLNYCYKVLLSHGSLELWPQLWGTLPPFLSSSNTGFLSLPVSRCLCRTHSRYQCPPPPPLTQLAPGYPSGFSSGVIASVRTSQAPQTQDLGYRVPQSSVLLHSALLFEIPPSVLFSPPGSQSPLHPECLLFPTLNTCEARGATVSWNGRLLRKHS